MSKINPIDVQKHLKGLDYPATKDDVVACAKKNGADATLLDSLNRLEDESFQTPADVSQAIGKLSD
jgi:hypothetical protein